MHGVGNKIKRKSICLLPPFIFLAQIQLLLTYSCSLLLVVAVSVVFVVVESPKLCAVTIFYGAIYFIISDDFIIGVILRLLSCSP